MRFIGSKINLLPEIEKVINENCDNTDKIFCDIFSGTGAVARYFKPRYRMITNDLMYFSYVLTAATIENNGIPDFACLNKHGISDPLAYLEQKNVSLKDGYITETYSPHGSAGRMYFTSENARKIDFARETIELWKQNEWISRNEYIYLLACLVEGVPFVSNITGTYGAFLKSWERRALKSFELQRLEVFDNNERNICYNEDANDLIKKISGDILYIDPPYNSRQYTPNYHVLETIARNDKPAVTGVTGMRDCSSQRSKYCSKTGVYNAFENLISDADFRHIIISYSNDGLLSAEDITALLKKHCLSDSVKVYEIDYNRYQGKIKTEKSRHFEYLFYARKPEVFHSSDVCEKAASKRNVTSKKKYVKSPMNYIGGKYKLLPRLIELFPTSVDTFVDLFAGSFTVAANVKAKKYICSDINFKIVEIVRMLCYSDVDAVLRRIHSKIDEYGLSKTNSEGYNKFREFYNVNKNPIDLFTLSCFSFNYQFRFNSRLEFNNPFGKNRSKYSEVTEKNLVLFAEEMKRRNIEFYCLDFREMPLSALSSNDFVYCDPPYLITDGSYNDGNRGFKDWREEEERALLDLLDELDKSGVRFALSNMLRHKGKENKILAQWAQKYNIHYINSDYSNCNYHLKTKERNKTVEVLITNY